MTTLNKAFGVILAGGVGIAAYFAYNTSPNQEANIGAPAEKNAPAPVSQKKADKKNMANNSAQESNPYYVPGYSNPVEGN